MPPNGFATWTDYWNSLADIQNENNAPQPGDLPRATTNSGSPNGFTPITNPGFTYNNVGTGPIQQDPGSANYGQPIQTNYNPNLYADPATAQRIAQQLGGKVIQGDPVGLGAAGSPFSAPSANMIQLPNGRVIDAGTIANYEQLYANNPQMLQAMVNGEITGTGQNPQAYQNSLSGWNPAQIAAANFTVNQLPSGAVVSGGGGTGGYNTGGTTGGGGTGGGGNQQYADPSMNLSLNYRPPARTVTNGTDPSAAAPWTNPNYPDPYSGGYPQVGTPTGMPYGAGAMGGFPTTTDANGNTVPSWSYKPTSNVGDLLQNSMSYAYGQGGELIGNYGTLMAQEQQRANQLASTGDSMYSTLMANPGYTAQQQTGIMDQSGLNALNWTPEMAQANQLTDKETAAWTGDPYAGYNIYAKTGTIPAMDANGNIQYQKDAQGNNILDANGNPMPQMQTQADYLNQITRQYAGNLSNIYDQGGTAIGDQLSAMGTGLSNAINPAQLGLSSQFTTNYNWTPEDSQNIINAAGRNVGMQTAAIQDQLQRQADAAGSQAPLALSAALARQRQTGDVASADAMTQAAIQAKQQELQVQQQLEQMRLGTQQDISTRQMQEATTMGQSGIAAEENLLSGRAGAALQTGLEGINEQNTIAGQEAQLTQAGELAAQQRAQAMAQNRQQISQANQAAQFQRGSYTDQATSQRNTQMADAARADQTQARQDVRNEEQTGYNESNSGMAGQLQTFGNVTGAQAASSAIAIKAAQLPTPLDKVIGAGVSAVSAEGGVYTKPTKAVVGEKGPELIIKLKHPNGSTMTYRRKNEAAYA